MPNVTAAPWLYHSSPAMLLASNAATLWKPVNVPIAVAVSFLSTTLVIHALAMPSVAAA